MAATKEALDRFLDVPLAAVAGHLRQGLLIVARDGSIAAANARAGVLLGASDPVGRRPDSLAGVGSALVRLLDESRETGHRADGAAATPQRELDMSAIPLASTAGDDRPWATPLTGCTLIVLDDQTALRRVEKVRRDFISNISHELRTPLASLKALVETLHGSARNDPAATTRFLERTDSELDLLSQMVEELLELSRIESRQVPVKPVPTPVPELVIPPVERLRPQAERGDLLVVTTLRQGLPPVMADASRIHQVVTNLVHNAIKFTPPGGSIEITACRGKPEGEDDASTVVISVADTGVGIPKEAKARIFERFYKADQARASAGTGLGLAIVKHLVHAHGGRVWATARKPAGSTFSFSLPVALPAGRTR